MKQNKRIPRISTRGFYDLASGKTLKKKPYDLYPKKFFQELSNHPEFTIMVHGLRNNKKGALAKFQIAQKRLRQLGYKYPVIGFSYDSNVKGVQYKSHEHTATKIGRMIAKKNGKNLAKFVMRFKKKHPNTLIRLIGHSLGTEVIFHALVYLKQKTNIIDTVYFFGSSIPTNWFTPKVSRILKITVRKKIFNYCSTHDDVLKHAVHHKIIEKPIGLGFAVKNINKYTQKHVFPKNHRFASYAMVLSSYK